ncbi:MAG: nicotinamide-nucleotide amidohydrolase family protein [Clostridia bacterium]|nr:nicotinamide-nucleotide amidohydrolase family protein [Clostridia bacterium]
MKELFSRLVGTLKSKGLTLSCAESCTGGLIAKCITDISGASSVFFGGVVSYANEVKQNVLGVEKEALLAFGAVSAPVAEQMARGVCSVCHTDIGISTTGIAGPDGGTLEKPVGTVFIGICIKNECFTERLCISPALSRDEIRHEAVFQLVQILLDKIS